MIETRIVNRDQLDHYLKLFRHNPFTKAPSGDGKATNMLCEALDEPVVVLHDDVTREGRQNAETFISLLRDLPFLLEEIKIHREDCL